MLIFESDGFFLIKNQDYKYRPSTLNSKFDLRYRSKIRDFYIEPLLQNLKLLGHFGNVLPEEPADEYVDDRLEEHRRELIRDEVIADVIHNAGPSENDEILDELSHALFLIIDYLSVEVDVENQSVEGYDKKEEEKERRFPDVGSSSFRGVRLQLILEWLDQQHRKQLNQRVCIHEDRIDDCDNLRN